MLSKVRTLVVMGLTALSVACQRGNAVKGKALFDSTCDVCHYTNSHVARAGPGLKDLYSRRTLVNGTTVNDKNVEHLIRAGTNLMPGYKNILSEEQMRDLIAYLRTL